MWLVLGITTVVVILLVVALWGSRGGIVAFIRGQAGPAFALDARTTRNVTSGDPIRVSLEIDRSNVVHTVAPEYLSVAIDLSQVTGGKWWDPDAQTTELGTGSVESPVFDFDRSALDRLVAPLAPAWLRIGGSESDKIYYDLENLARSRTTVPHGYESVLTVGQWDALNAFAQRNGLRVIFTLNAGPSSRSSTGAWNPENAAALVGYTAGRDYPVELWELGNEVNNFWYVFGPANHVNARRYAEDSRVAATMIAREMPGSRFAGQGGMYWPVLGQPLKLFFGMSQRTLRHGGDLHAVVSWHYYPQQGRRGPIASRRAHPLRLLEPANLNEAAEWGREVRRARDRWAPEAELWLGETGNAQFGGEPGLSDVYLGGLWWLDQLGLLARERHSVVVRQSLTGQNYGLLADETLQPRPDYWNSLAWKELMGREVLVSAVRRDSGTRRDDARRIRSYAHRNSESGEVTVLVINLHYERAAEIDLSNVVDRTNATVYSFDTADIFSDVVAINGRELTLSEDGRPPSISSYGRALDAATLVLAPLSYAFVVTP